MARKCTNCGCDLKTKARFCPECGAIVEEPPKEVKSKKDAEAALQDGKKKGTGKKIAVVSVVILALLGVGGLAFAQMSNKKEGPVKKQEATDTKKKTTKKKEIVKKEEPEACYYKWRVKPTIEADQIYYVVGSSTSMPFNDYHKQYNSPDAVIEKDGLKGWIDSTGTLYTNIQYDNIACVDDDYEEICLMKTPQGGYQEYSNYESSQVKDIDSALAYMDYNGAFRDFDSDDDYAVDMDAMTKETENLTNNPYWNVGYYYDGEVRYVHTTEYGKNVGDSVLENEEAMPMRESNKILTTLAEWKALDGKYAIVKGGKPTTDFIYDECGSEGEGLFAVCQDGKWGYVDETGRVVIPLEYDTSWNRYVADEGQATNVDAAQASDNYCYAAANGYVNLRQGDKWKLCDIYGKEIIPFGEFEEILPVTSQGLCWVKQDGKWGVIQISDTEVVTTEFTEWKDVYVDWVNSHGDEYTYELLDLGNDVVPELVAIAKDSTEDSVLISYGYDSVDTEDVEGKSIQYIPGEGILAVNGGSMDDYFDKFYTIENNYFELYKTGRYYRDEASELQLDESGNPIYVYEWGDEDVSKEQYEQNKESLMPSDKAVTVKETGASSSEIITQIRDFKK